MAILKELQKPGDEHFETPWWLDGDEVCGVCCQLFAVDLTVYCCDCDAPVCPLCIVEMHKAQAMYCPECAEQ